MTFYNPHLLARQDLIDTFVARQPLLDEMVDHLRRGGGGHHLLIGGRGSGKTTLLLRLATALEDDKQLARKCIPLRFPEEQYNVSRPSDFWMNTIDALVDALERQNDRAAAKRLETTLTELDPLDEDVRAKRSLAILEDWAKQARRLIVLLVDNLDLVLDRLADSLWGLREALSVDNRLVVVGASSRFIEEAIDYQSPFYDFFHVHELGPLSEEDARRLVLSLARRAHTPRVAQALERDPGRFKALYVLTDGTPRTLALLHSVLALEHSDRIERDLDGLLDQLTPYYKARFDDLPSQSQVIFDKVALHWHPITAAECHAATHLDINIVSAQLSRLVKIGLLAKVSLPGSKLGFQLSERFFNIWYLMRASRRLRRRLAWFVESLRIIYGEEDLQRRAEEIVQAAPAESVNSPAKLLAFASVVQDDALRRQLEFRAISLLVEEEADTIARHPTTPIRVKQRLSKPVEEGKIQQLAARLNTMRITALDLGSHLRNAIATGEVPSLGDVRTPEEMRQIIELTELPSLTIFALVLATESARTSLSDEVILQMLPLNATAAEQIIGAASLVVLTGNWARADHLVRLVIRHAGREISAAALINLLRRYVVCNLSVEALKLIVDLELSERWAPLYEALHAIATGDRARLDALAPEMQTVALDLYDHLTGSGASQEVHAPEQTTGKSSHTMRKRSELRAVSRRTSAQGKPRRRGLPGPNQR